MWHGALINVALREESCKRPGRYLASKLPARGLSGASRQQHRLQRGHDQQMGVVAFLFMRLQLKTSSWSHAWKLTATALLVTKSLSTLTFYNSFGAYYVYRKSVVTPVSSTYSIVFFIAKQQCCNSQLNSDQAICWKHSQYQCHYT